MTSHGYRPTFAAQTSSRARPQGVPGGFKVLPLLQEERLRRSFDNLSSSESSRGSGGGIGGGAEDDSGGGGVRIRETMEDVDDVAPDYGDDGDDNLDDTDTILLRPLSFSSSSSTADLSSLPQLTEETVLQVVKDRYQQDQIFTRCGDVLISVNPFKQLSIFDEETHEDYSLDCLSKHPEPEPHLFWMAAEAVACRSRENVNQVVLVSGESGAGKTEAVKLMLRHILYLSTSRQDRMFDSLDKVNPLIELFGNARTQLNGNSSRFAKFLEVQFSKEGDSPTGTVIGATIRDYILEKSRVTSPTEGESNFHIFYTFLDDVMSKAERQKLFLMEDMDKYKHFRIVPKSSWPRTNSTMSSKEQARVFKYIGMGEAEIENMHVVLAAILHLTNIRFEEDDISAGGVMVENEDSLRKAAALMSVDAEKLARLLVTRKGKFSGSEIEMFQSQAKAEETRDAMAKALYERLFGWLIRTINSGLSRHSPTEAGIWFLDICGFEDLRHNSLEQLCINLANEQLQQFMTQHVFTLEVRHYQQQGLALPQAHVQPPSNEAILSMFDAPKTGILALINEDTRVEIATEETLVRKLCTRHAQAPNFMRYKNDDPRFGIQHFAGPVWYDARQFLEKNGDFLSREVKDILVASSNELISDIFQVEKAITGSIAPTNFNYRVSTKRAINYQQLGQSRLSESVVRGLRQSLHDRFHGQIPPRTSFKDTGRSKLTDQRTVIDCFQASMKELLNKMRTAHALFVRCIKPNDQQVPDLFEDRKVGLQLRYNGVTEIARIRKIWFPVRLKFNDFLTKYCILSQEAMGEKDKKRAVVKVLRHLGVPSEHFAMGTTLVFLKDHVVGLLEEKLREEKRRKKEKKQQEERERKAKEEARKQEAEAKRVREVKEKLSSFIDISVRNPTMLETVQEVPTPSSSKKSFATLDLPRTPSTVSTTSSKSANNKEEEEEEANSEVEEDDEEIEKQQQQQQQQQETETRDKFWDIFRIVAREKEKTDIHHLTAMKILKMLAYVFIFLLVLLSSTAQRTSLMVMVSAMQLKPFASKDDRNVSTAYYILMMVAVCIPYMLTFLVSMAKVCFGGFRNPSLGTWIWMFVAESLHSLGLTLLIFRVLPRLDVLHGLLFLCAVGLIPSLFKLVTSVDVRVSRLAKPRYHLLLTRIGSVTLDLLAFAGQVSVFPAVYAMAYISTGNDVGDGEEAVWGYLDVAGATLVSVVCWENFMDGRFFLQLGETNPVKNFLLKRRFDLQRGRHIPQMVVSVWKIVLTIVLAYFIRGQRDFDYEDAFDTLSRFQNQWKLITSIVVLTLSALVCYYFSYIACKLWMQRLSFVIPLTLSTPCTILIFYFDHEYHFLSSVTKTAATGDFYIVWPEDVRSHWKTLVFGAVWFLSLLLLTRHVWWPRQNRLEKFGMMFMNPMYCGILTMETLFMNRRRHTLSCRKKRISIGIESNSSSRDRWIYRMDKTEKRSEKNPDYVDEIYAEIGDSATGHYDTENPVSSADYGGMARRQEGDEDVPTIYACATMWHEVRREMVALLKSLHRIDLEQWTRKQAQEISGTRDKDYFEYEAHIFFDDAMTLDDDEEYIPNDYVKMVVEVMEEAVSSVYKKTMTVAPPLKIATPYGGQLLWVMPGGNLLFVHLKDKTKIRHRKRWSQVMYMYYLLGFRLTRQCQNQILEALKEGRNDVNSQWAINRDDVVGSEIFDMLDEKVATKSQNTFVMALDGDTDFSPGAVHILLDRMKKNPKVAAACGRIHPIGSGPLVWYQMFEYAIGHWMQKATEHVLGCVLCSPGCFSLFRGSALMDDNVMRKYAILPTEPGHFLQYDQGEDRWLCTLLLQQGYRVDYAAAADAWTYAPEGFNEFFNQRRRWMPSTLANVMDLLSDYSNTVAVNSNISMLYIIYQVALMVATLIGPGTVLMMIAGAIEVVFKVNIYWSYIISIVPAVIYLFVCLYCKTNIQLYLAALLSTFYAFVMMIVFVGVIVIAAQESVFHPSVLVILFLVFIFTIAGLCHPMEIYCLPAGALYLLCIPSGYLLLVIYSLCNLHVVSWGTREAPKKKTKAEMAQEKLEAEQKQKEKAQKKGFFSRFFFSSYLNDLKEIVQSASGSLGKAGGSQEEKSLQLLQQINENLQKIVVLKDQDQDKPGEGGKQATGSDPEVTLHKVVVQGVKPALSTSTAKAKDKPKKKVKIQAPEPPRETRDQLVNPKWIEDKGLGNGETMKLFDEEMDFWKAFVKKYLAPLDADKEKEKEMMKGLMELRNQVIFGFSMINLLWIAINFMFQYVEAIPVTIPIDGGVKVGILGLLFVFFLLAILLLQILGMIVHRWGTLLHLLAFTDIHCPCFSTKVNMKDQNNDKLRKALEFCRKIISEPLPDYLDEDNDNPAGTTVRETIQEIIRKSVKGTSQAFGRQSVVRSFRDSGVLDRDFVNSRPFSLYLRGTQQHTKEDEEDVDATNFVADFRSNLYERNPNRYTNGHPGSRRPWSGLGADGGGSDTNGAGYPRAARGDGLAPPIPRRQNSSHFSQGVRRRLQANNLRYAARNTIQRFQQEARRQIPASRRQPEFGASFRFGGGAGGAGGASRFPSGDGAAQGGAMDRAFSRRLQMFSDYSRGAGRDYGRPSDILHA